MKYTKLRYSNIKKELVDLTLIYLAKFAIQYRLFSLQVLQILQVLEILAFSYLFARL